MLYRYPRYPEEARSFLAKELQEGRLTSFEEVLERLWAGREEEILAHYLEEQERRLAEQAALAGNLEDGLVRRSLEEMRLRQFHSPFAFREMEKAVSLLHQAIVKQGRVLIHGDFDTDGLTASVLLWSFLREQGLEQVDIYIPDRLDEGYGVSLAGVQLAIQQKVDLFVTVDCGVSSPAPFDLLRKAGIPSLLTDHHQCLPQLPAADACLNPNWREESYPFPFLAGAGVAFKLIQAYCECYQLPDSCWERQLDLAALGTVADLMWLVGENLLLVEAALSRWKERGWRLRPAMQVFLEEKKLSRETLSSKDWGFLLAPRLNAAGRMSQIQPALDFLRAESVEEARQYWQQLEVLNERRRQEENRCLEEARKLLLEQENWVEAPLLLLAKADWHPGVLGLVAGRLSREFEKNVLLLSLQEKEGQLRWKGSGRAVAQQNLLQLIKAYADHFERFGGHAQALGVELTESQLSLLQQLWQQSGERENMLEALGRNKPSPLYFCPPSKWCHLAEVENLQASCRLEGRGRELPAFLFRGLKLRHCQLMGKESQLAKKHLRLELETADGLILQAVFFGAGLYSQFLRAGDVLEVEAELAVNRFRDQKNVQLRILSLRKQPSPFRPAEDRLQEAQKSKPFLAEYFQYLYQFLQNMLTAEEGAGNGSQLVEAAFLADVLEGKLGFCPSEQCVDRSLRVLTESGILKGKSWRRGEEGLLYALEWQQPQSRPKLSATPAYTELLE